ncbi:Apt Adenine/guanine phosphoribosyltransferases and related PRPP-binding proteins [Candidatus Nanopelagicaceae bacterium]
MQLQQALALVRDIPDFPHSGILFKDITPLLADPTAFALVTSELAGDAERYSHVVGIEARGFILGAAIASHSERGFVPLRKAGKLPHTTISKSYGLEYGVDVLEAHVDAVREGDSVLLVDDVLATGGTLLASIELIYELGASISEVVVLYEISFLKGREKILTKFPEIIIRSIVAN